MGFRESTSAWKAPTLTQTKQERSAALFDDCNATKENSKASYTLYPKPLNPLLAPKPRDPSLRKTGLLCVDLVSALGPIETNSRLETI